MKDVFTRNDTNVNEMIADTLAITITNTRICTESKEHDAVLSVLVRTSKQISHHLEPTIVMDPVVRDGAVSWRKPHPW